MQLERDTGRPWPYRFHDLRHFAATEALRAGFSATDAAHRLGHADATLIHTTYGHGTEERARALAEALDGGFS
jgi:integrase